jgi:hypothetical protein
VVQIVPLSVRLPPSPTVTNPANVTVPVVP